MALRDNLGRFEHLRRHVTFEATGIGADEDQVVLGDKVLRLLEFFGSAERDVFWDFRFLMALVEEDEAAVCRLLLESTEAADGLAGVTTQHEWENVVCERLLDGEFELLESPHDSELVMGTVICLQ
jgi:hypothetical protein